MQTVNIRKVENSRVNFQSNKQQFSMLKNIFADVYHIQTTCWPPFNNANHTRRRILSLLTNIQTTSLQMINHNKQSQQPFHFVNKLYVISNKNNIFVNSLPRFIQTANKMLINNLQEIYSLRYGIHHELASLIQSKQHH